MRNFENLTLKMKIFVACGAILLRRFDGLLMIVLQANFAGLLAVVMRMTQWGRSAGRFP